MAALAACAVLGLAELTYLAPDDPASPGAAPVARAAPRGVGPAFQDPTGTSEHTSGGSAALEREEPDPPRAARHRPTRTEPVRRPRVAGEVNPCVRYGMGDPRTLRTTRSSRCLPASDQVGSARWWFDCQCHQSRPATREAGPDTRRTDGQLDPQEGSLGREHGCDEPPAGRHAIGPTNPGGLPKWLLQLKRDSYPRLETCVKCMRGCVGAME